MTQSPNSERAALPGCAVMVLNWNGAGLLARCLPSVVAAARRAAAEVVVVDNASTDDSEKLCRTQFPSVRFEQLGVNRILAGYNLAAMRCDKQVIVLLNNDIVVDEHFLEPLLRQFEDANLFGAGCCLRSFPPAPDAPLESEAHRVVWNMGMLRSEPYASSDVTSTFYVSGGAGAFDRIKFLELGGFDELYRFYHEDVDLSWRAWKRGWRCVYEPHSVVYHMGGASIGRSARVRATMLRNEFLFHWKNLTSPSMIATHALLMLPRLLAAAARGDGARIAGFFQALTRLGPVLSNRRRARLLFQRDDAEALRAANDGALFPNR